MSAVKPIENDRDPRWHRDKLAEFTLAKARLGEPSPHMTMVKYMSEGEEWWEQVWRAGCYAVPYSVLTAEILWTYWPWARVRREPEKLRAWIEEHWKVDGELRFHTRTERRCVRSAEKFTRSLLSYADWAALSLSPLLTGKADYDKLWTSANTIYGMGRYIVIRLLELYRREGFTDAGLYDIRSIGGWSPVRALTLFYPEDEDSLLSGNSVTADGRAMQLYYELKAEGVPDLNYYVFAAMLCEYREALEDSHQFPGHTIDQELSYFHKKAPYWQAQGFESKLFEVRSQLFPREALGELSGWGEYRKDLARLLHDHGIVWSDLKYDYLASKNDLAHPIVRP